MLANWRLVTGYWSSANAYILLLIIDLNTTRLCFWSTKQQRFWGWSCYESIIQIYEFKTEVRNTSKKSLFLPLSYQKSYLFNRKNHFSYRKNHFSQWKNYLYQKMVDQKIQWRCDSEKLLGGALILEFKRGKEMESSNSRALRHDQKYFSILLAKGLSQLLGVGKQSAGFRPICSACDFSGSQWGLSIQATFQFSCSNTIRRRDSLMAVVPRMGCWISCNYG